MRRFVVKIYCKGLTVLPAELREECTIRESGEAAL